MRAALRTATVTALAAAAVPACAELDEPVAVERSEVVGGQNAPAGKWPDVAAILAQGQQFCTGTLIAPTVVLTAGHCNDPELTHVLVGTSSLERPAEGEVLPVAARHEYPNPLNTMDLTVVVLGRASQRKPRPLATGWAAADIQNDARVAIVGYGAVDRDANRYIPELQEAETTITDFDCSRSVGCNAPVRPAGELGAGGMGIDTCPGDSGGPLYLLTDYGTFLAGVTSRGYDNNRYECTEGGIYARPDKVVAWIEEQAGVRVARGPEPTAEPISAGPGSAGETRIVPHDPRSDRHRFEIKQPPARGAAAVRDDGQVRVCTSPEATGDDVVIVSVTDDTNPARTLDVAVRITVTGEPGEACDVEAFGEGIEGGGCCDAGRSAKGSIPLALGVLVALRRRRRRS